MSTADNSSLKQIAFVAMPFRIKETGLEPGKGPTRVDFDALWDLAFYPALEELGYLPIRADNQDGSMIIKDMLEQLVFADLVLVDISIPNGNVYYEAGIRHAARAKGCVLVNAEWSQPLFDLAQIRGIMYPLQSEAPTQSDYEAIKNKLVAILPALAIGEGPVYSLINNDTLQKGDSRVLREAADILAEFQMDVRACRLASEEDIDGLIEELAEKYLTSSIKLPLYAARELLELHRDKQGWEAVLALHEKLDDVAHSDPFIIEQLALAKCKLGDPKQAIVEIEQLISSHGKTTERLGLLGGRCKELVKSQSNKLEQKKWLAKAIQYYEEGMLLDLNEFYCASNLPALLLARNGPEDFKKMQQITDQVLLACQRKEAHGQADDWLLLTRLTMMFLLKEIQPIKTIIDQLLMAEIANWKITAAVTDIKDILGHMDDDIKPELETLLDDLILHICIDQEKLTTVLLPRINECGTEFKKFQVIHARRAKAGETIVSYTSDGRETENTASAGEYIVENQTAAKEQYIVTKAKFEERYELQEAIDDQWSRYAPSGRIRGLEVDESLMKLLKQYGTFYIYASWDSPQKVEKHDYLVSPLPNLDEVYRIARAEFEETYQPEQ